MITKIKRIGYWRQYEDSNEDLPWPDTTDRQIPDDTKRRVISYLRCGITHAAWMGISRCRLCGCSNGSTCMTDRKYFIWPEGYAHYIDKHNITIDPDLLAHVLSQ